MAVESNVVRAGIYNVEYFSGAQVSLYIGDIWVDEVTTLSYQIQQNRQPIYGYASQLYDDLSEGQVLVTGTFTLNFKEAGYLWLILDRYRQKFRGQASLTDKVKPFRDSSSVNKNTVERLINNETDVFERNRLLQDLAKEIATSTGEDAKKYREDLRLGLVEAYADSRAETAASLQGYASNTRAGGGIGRAEDLYETFEDAVWRKSGIELDNATRRTDDPRLNPFDIYVAFGDFAGDNSVNHTIERIRDVSILGKSKQVVIDGMPIQEQYTFLGRNLV